MSTFESKRSRPSRQRPDRGDAGTAGSGGAFLRASPAYSTVTLFARFRGWSTSVPFSVAM
jgi:hypothetical protein